MRFLKLSGHSASQMFDPDDTGGTGDPDNGDPGAQPDGGTPPPPPAGADLKAVADSIRQAIVEARATVPVAVPIAVSTGPSDAVRRELEAESAAVNTKFNELVNAGNAAEAMALRDAFINKANRMLAPSQDDNAVVKTAVAFGERLARTEHKDVMTRWSGEVRAIVNAMPVDERISPDAWDKAVSRVKSDHITELVAEQTAAGIAEARKSFVPPPSAPGSRGSRRLEGPAAKLSEEQLWGADLCGVDAKDYAAELAREVAYDALPFKERGPFPGYPLLSNDVKPGGF